MSDLTNPNVQFAPAAEASVTNVAARLVPSVVNISDPAGLDPKLSWMKHDTLGRRGAEIAVLYECVATHQRVALVRCERGAFSASHLHGGHETFHVLSGTFHDDHGQYGPGDIVVYPPGSTHGWTSPTGALILAIWGGPVCDVNVDAKQSKPIEYDIDARNWYPFVHTV